MNGRIKIKAGLAGLLLLLSVPFCRLRAEEYVKYVQKIFPLHEKTDCLIDSRFGQIVIRQWAFDSVRVEASFRIRGVESWEKESLAGLVGLKGEEWPGTLKISTVTDTAFERQGDLVVEMKIWVPEMLVLDVVNRYGSIYLPYYKASAHLSLSSVYGDIQVDTLEAPSGQEVYLNVAYGKLNVRSCQRAIIRSVYSSLGVEKSRYLQIKAEKSFISLQQTDSLISEGKYNQYKIK